MKQTDSNTFIGWTTVSSKGQISIPAKVRKQLGIVKGARMLIVLRKDGDGINLIQSEAVDYVFKEFST